MNFDFILGEKKYIQFQVKSTIQQKVVITSATWSLKHAETMEEVLTGTCEIENDSEIQLLLMPEANGQYILEVTYTIPPEIRKVRCGISVL
jgi:hypothetical protein